MGTDYYPLYTQTDVRIDDPVLRQQSLTAEPQINYMHFIPMIREEKIKMYMKKCKKKQLAEMLATCNEILDALPPMAYYSDESGKWKAMQDGNGIFRTRENIDIK